MVARMFLSILMLSHVATAQTHTDSITSEFSFEKKTGGNALVIANLFGSVKVEGYPGDKVRVKATRIIHAKNQARLEKGMAELRTALIDRADTLIVYVNDGCHQFGKNNGRHHDGKGWGYQSLSNDDCHAEYDYRIDFVVQVPHAANLVISTINDGDLHIQNMDGVVKASNINGSIRLLNLKSPADARTINGDVDVEYAQNPGDACRFYTLNGDINAVFPSGLSADLAFESFNGSFYTNIAQLENLPLRVQKTTAGNGLRYKINGNRYQVGRGGPLLDFETFNGNVYLKEK